MQLICRIGRIALTNPLKIFLIIRVAKIKGNTGLVFDSFDEIKHCTCINRTHEFVAVGHSSAVMVIAGRVALD